MLYSIFCNNGNDSYVCSTLQGGYGCTASINTFDAKINLGTSINISSTTYKVCLIKSFKCNSFNHQNMLALTIRLC